MTNLITIEQVMQGLRGAVAERGRDHRDPNAAAGLDCMYVSKAGQEPVCVGGAALHKAGVSLDELKLWEGLSARAMIPGAAKLCEEGHPMHGRDSYGIVTQAAGDLLSLAQAMNDAKSTWGTILDRVEAAYGKRTEVTA